MTAVWDVNLPHADKIVLLALADNANDEGHCWPSITTLARKCGMDRRTVLRVISTLEDLRHLTRISHVGLTNSYNVHPWRRDTSDSAPPVVYRHHTRGGTPRVPVADNHGTRGGPPPITIIEPSIEPSLEPSTRAREAKGRKVSRETDPEWFIEFKLAYPDRAGDQGWRKASKAANARFAEGHTPAELIAGARRYAAFIEATGKSATEYVKQAATFLGPDKPFLLPWKPPPKAETATDRMLRMLNANDDRVIEHDDPGKFLITSQ